MWTEKASADGQTVSKLKDVLGLVARGGRYVRGPWLRLLPRNSGTALAGGGRFCIATASSNTPPKQYRSTYNEGWGKEHAAELSKELYAKLTAFGPEPFDGVPVGFNPRDFSR